MPLPVNGFLKKLATNVNNNVPRNPPPYSSALFLIVSLKTFINKPDSLKDVTFSIISSMSTFEVIEVVRFAKPEGRIPDPKKFF